jgi:hypothetical protein
MGVYRMVEPERPVARAPLIPAFSGGERARLWRACQTDVVRPGDSPATHLPGMVDVKAARARHPPPWLLWLTRSVDGGVVV